jgi:hypothetical protein
MADEKTPKDQQPTPEQPAPAPDVEVVSKATAAEEPYIGVDPIYQNHASDTEAPLLAEPGKVPGMTAAEVKQVVKLEEDALQRQRDAQAAAENPDKPASALDTAAAAYSAAVDASRS